MADDMVQRNEDTRGKMKNNVYTWIHFAEVAGLRTRAFLEQLVMTMRVMEAIVKDVCFPEWNLYQDLDEHDEREPTVTESGCCPSTK